jgi:hypothetical protein
VCASGEAVAQRAQDIGVQPPPQQQPSEPIVVQPPSGADGSQPQAQPPPERPPTQPVPKKPAREEKEWYGWQTLLADVAAAGLMAGGEISHTTSIFDVGYGTFLLAPPVVHVVHGNAGPAFGSVGLRLVGPWICAFLGIVGGAFVLAGQSGDNGNSSTTDTIFGIGKGWSTPIAVGFDIGLVGGYALAVGIDAFLIAYEKVDDNEYGTLERKRPSPTREAKWFTWSPTTSLAAHGGTVGVGGTF